MHTRRTFIQTLAAGTALAGTGLWQQPVWAAPVSTGQALAGADFDLYIGEQTVNITGTPRTAQTINGSLPGPLLRWREGDTVSLRVRNRLKETTSVHWHGIVLPADMDGVPGLSRFKGIAPGEYYDYRFTLRQNGTYWYHSHSGFQEQRGVYGPLIIDPATPAPYHFDREHVLMLSDWTDQNPERVFARLKEQPEYYQQQRTLVDFIHDVAEQGFTAAVKDRAMWARMRMSPTDIADVSGQAYTYLVNGHGPQANWTGLFKPGETVLLRLINGSAMSYFDLRIPGLKLRVVAADGQYVQPVDVDEVRLAVAETLDVLVEPGDAAAYTVFAQAMDRSGYARATLAQRAGAQAQIPALDPQPLLTMADMGMNHSQMQGMDHSQMQGMDHSQMQGMDHGQMQGMDHGRMQGMDHGQMQGMDQGQMQSMDHSQMPAANPLAQPVRHPASETDNPLVDMQAQNPMPKLDDPGIGLRGNGRSVLTYADLRSAFPDPDGREPSRTLELHLTGHMGRFAWSFDGVKFADAAPIVLKHGERVRIVLVNDTMMAHPIHLHGMWSDLEDEQGRFMVRKHTLDIPPGTRRSYRVTADALGRWAYHCHMLYHMEAGMFREVRVDA
ncbi:MULTISPECIES: copper resistance system multicopper oxidase [unclassified Pseudomonas]|uniref:copper resistance system multicopper oxidase n=1 Tax=unclassified Pseudomonas TaxID=196821 RepID=UPI000BD1B138|nr:MULTISPECIES: copper resistance system multicopper oxidase [unclassified Pseudomonas]PVZ12504.1 CopA family copper-resistance protein [Pseudomonas sp. URIL14HWK12:I12]PVZ23344.1 CopA family copper-resistance protein [Pseudomonas sp. URIL14HWK12:I10]PVZ32674.1 CopA family copper-resistance protein [Pseudomonas sp. URIL14HWK12:I11]SNZ13828.1 copper-resistance protein, CopA family [Pseudomonas sp. URIL14HWK12:I9]